MNPGAAGLPGYCCDLVGVAGDTSSAVPADTAARTDATQVIDLTNTDDESSPVADTMAAMAGGPEFLMLCPLLLQGPIPDDRQHSRSLDDVT